MATIHTFPQGREPRGRLEIALADLSGLLDALLLLDEYAAGDPTFAHAANALHCIAGDRLRAAQACVGGLRTRKGKAR